MGAAMIASAAEGMEARANTGKDWKAAAVEQWSADPCGQVVSDGQPGSREYVEELIDYRRRTHAWMTDFLDYQGSAGLDVLDVGCGQGLDAVQYAAGGARASGVDLTPRHVELAGQHLGALGLSADIRLGDAERLPFDDAAFDRVSSNGVLHHTPDMPAALREIRRVLRPGGDVRVIVYNQRSLHYWVNQFFMSGILNRQLLRERSMAGVLSANVEVSSVGARPLVRAYRPGQVRRMLEAAGFEGVTAGVRHFRPEDTFISDIAIRRFPRLGNDAALDRLGRVAGWYVIARGVRTV
jgi:ubiquinone/menaquinone biosynthesis C-methylase UbiE